MLLTIDIGNTNISFGLFKGKRLSRRLDVSTKDIDFRRLKQNLNSMTDIDDVVICSVVPESTRILVNGLTKILGKPPYIIGKDIRVPLKNLYRNPRQVGQDRLVNAFCASYLFGAPLIVVDFGTAITFDIVSKNKEYLGGMILPGLGISLDSLSQRTALLPKIKLTQPKEFIGKNTRDSMLSGIVYGFAALTDGLIEKLKQKLGRDALVIGTGGNINLISKYCKRIDKTDINLTLKGLNIIYYGCCAV